MKFIFVFFTILLCSSASADMYKCDIDGKTSYQDEPCEKRGGTGHKFNKLYEISKEQQKQAKAKLDLEEALIAEQEQLEKEAYDKERLIRAEEDKAIAAQEYAEQARRQTEALEERNDIESRKPKVVYDRRGYFPNIHNPVIQHDVRPHRPFEKNERNNRSVAYPNKQRKSQAVKSKHSKMMPVDRMGPADRMSP